jgi:hypothetical protein
MKHDCIATAGLQVLLHVQPYALSWLVHFQKKITTPTIY